jgi:hypothetical protein
VSRSAHISYLSFCLSLAFSFIPSCFSVLFTSHCTFSVTCLFFLSPLFRARSFLYSGGCRSKSWPCHWLSYLRIPCFPQLIHSGAFRRFVHPLPHNCRWYSHIAVAVETVSSNDTKTQTVLILLFYTV